VTNANVFQLCQPGTFADPLTEILRNGARALLAQAVEAESVTPLGPPTPLIRNPQDAKSRNKERTARGHQLCYFLVEMNALTESANGEGNAIKENNIIARKNNDQRHRQTHRAQSRLRRLGAEFRR
jgi:hypothetical protein